MRLRSFLGFAIAAIGLCAILAPLDVLQMISGGAANLVLTAADNPLSIEALLMVAISIVLTVTVAVVLIALIDNMKTRVRVSNNVYVRGRAGDALIVGDMVHLDRDGRYRRTFPMSLD